MPKEKEKIQITEDGDEDVETEWDEVLQNASEEELVDLAGVFPFRRSVCLNSCMNNFHRYC